MIHTSKFKAHMSSIVGCLTFTSPKVAAMHRRINDELVSDAKWIIYTCDHLNIDVDCNAVAIYTRQRVDKAKRLIQIPAIDSKLRPLSEVLGLAAHQVNELRDLGVQADIAVYRVREVFDTDQHGAPLPNWTLEQYFIAPRTETFTNAEVEQLPLAETLEDGELLAGLLYRLYDVTGKGLPPLYEENHRAGATFNASVRRGHA